MFASLADALALAGQLFRMEPEGQAPFVLNGKGHWLAPEALASRDQLMGQLTPFRPLIAGWAIQAAIGDSTVLTQSGRQLMLIAVEIADHPGVQVLARFVEPGLGDPALSNNFLFRQVDGLQFVTDGREAYSRGRVGHLDSGNGNLEGWHEFWTRLLILSQDADGLLAQAANAEVRQSVYSLAQCDYLNLIAAPEGTRIVGWLREMQSHSPSILRFFTYTANPAIQLPHAENSPLARALQTQLATTSRRDWSLYLAKAGQQGHERPFEVEVYAGQGLYGLQIHSELVFGPRGSVIGHHHRVVEQPAPVYDKPSASRSASAAATSEDAKLLIAEANHRIKNSLSVAASLMQLQSYSVEDEGARRILTESVQRLYTVADLHEALYRFVLEGTELVRMKPFLDMMAERLQKLIAGQGMEIRTDIEDLDMPGKLANRVGLLVNELVLNAAKYAFPGGSQGYVAIYLAKTSTGYYLSVQDNGQGMETRSQNDATSLGQTLIQEFAKDLQAEMRLETQAGTRYVFTFTA